MKINARVENIFAHAVALQQSGRLRSTVYCLKKKVYIYNQDQTMLFQFLLRDTDSHFDEPASFHANDYDSQTIEMEGGKISFIQNEAGYDRIKSCQVPAQAPREVQKLFKSFDLKEQNEVRFHEKFLSLIDDSLSHIEFSAVDGELVIQQRNIYSGSVTTMKREAPQGFIDDRSVLDDFAPIGLRTNDFLALFAFAKQVDFFFPVGSDHAWVRSKDKSMKFKCVISKCVYDELGGSDGRKK